MKFMGIIIHTSKYYEVNAYIDYYKNQSKQYNTPVDP